MINLSKKGTSGLIISGIIFFVVFFTIEFFIVTYLGAGDYVTAPEIEAPTTPDTPPASLWDAVIQSIVWPIENLGYFFNLLVYGGSFGIFNGILLVVFSILVLMYILQLVRGN